MTTRASNTAILLGLPSSVDAYTAPFQSVRGKPHLRPLTIDELLQAPWTAATIPQMITPTVAASTRQLTQKELELKPPERLHAFGVLPSGVWENVLEQLDQSSIYKKFSQLSIHSVSPEEYAFARCVDPQITGYGLSEIMQSEECVADHCTKRIFGPAMFLIQAMVKFNGGRSSRDPRLVAGCPTFSSFSGSKHEAAPDRMINDSENHRRIAIELKTKNSSEQFIKLLRQCADLQKQYGGSVPIPFHWPQSTACGKAQRIICQVRILNATCLMPLAELMLICNRSGLSCKPSR